MFFTFGKASELRVCARVCVHMQQQSVCLESLAGAKGGFQGAAVAAGGQGRSCSFFRYPFMLFECCASYVWAKNNHEFKFRKKYQVFLLPAFYSCPCLLFFFLRGGGKVWLIDYYDGSSFKS